MNFKKTPKGYLVTSNNFEPGEKGIICDLCKFEDMPAMVEPCNSCGDTMEEAIVKALIDLGWTPPASG